MGCGIASGENRAEEAAQKAISSPLLEGISIKGAKNILLNVTASSNLTMKEINDGNQVIYDAAGEEANIIFGLVQKEEMNEYVSYTVIATGFNTASGFGRTTKPKQEVVKPKEEEKNPFEPFTIKDNFTLNENDDLDIPTIQRMGGNLNLFGDENNKQNGFNFEGRVSKPENTNTMNDEEDSSDFLRMMMD
jgi:cell division protein FtsZ